MFDEKRYVIIDRNAVTPEIISQTEMNNPRPVKFAGDPVEYVILKWRGDKPAELWGEFPVYSDEEINDICEQDLYTIEAKKLL